MPRLLTALLNRGRRCFIAQRILKVSTFQKYRKTFHSDTKNFVSSMPMHRRNSCQRIVHTHTLPRISQNSQSRISMRSTNNDPDPSSIIPENKSNTRATQYIPKKSERNVRLKIKILQKFFFFFRKNKDNHLKISISKFETEKKIHVKLQSKEKATARRFFSRNLITFEGKKFMCMYVNIHISIFIF